MALRRSNFSGKTGICTVKWSNIPTWFMSVVSTLDAFPVGSTGLVVVMDVLTYTLMGDGAQSSTSDEVQQSNRLKGGVRTGGGRGASKMSVRVLLSAALLLP